MEGDGVSGDDIHEQVECQAALVAETILKFLDVELDSSPANLLLEKELEQVKVALDDLIKLQKLKCGRAIAESLSEMEDFLGLIFRLMKVMITSKYRDITLYRTKGSTKVSHQFLILESLT